MDTTQAINVLNQLLGELYKNGEVKISPQFYEEAHTALLTLQETTRPPAITGEVIESKSQKVKSDV